MKISLAHKSASKLIAVRAETNKSISELMEEAMQLLVEKYNVSEVNLIQEELKLHDPLEYMLQATKDAGLHYD